ncbi:hypothetical protein [Paenibacillus sacheonensis]|uniref:Uncharacterized protein n=1 Tax=Paenibacillus sacheonensis TaxID=742054 RepID=A0A7X4YUQ8_9BACL|nr:hypothetical protein [Paenibacillus sacheonensis]MBM7569122.1 hypothetical protein [Paenibacillus sacheonensis]NBC72956.1 hypothetical protein [Paenibacillus sacheonensis]
MSEQNDYNRRRTERQKSRAPKPAYAASPASLPADARQALLAAADAAADWQAACRSLSGTAAALIPRHAPLFAKRIVVSEAAVAGSAKDGADIGSFRVQTFSLARPQRNISFALTANAPSVASPGEHRLILHTASGSETMLTITLRPNETNRSVLRRIRDAVYASSLGLTAEVVTDSSEGTDRLELRSLYHGVGHAFRLEDHGSSSLVRATGIGSIANPASDAVYAIDGGPSLSSPSNEITVRNGQVQLDLSALRIPSAVTVKVQQDHTSFIRQLRQLAEGVNALHESDRLAAGSLDPRPLQRIEAALAHPGAQAAGLYRTSDGLWQLDEEKLHNAASNSSEDLRQQLTGWNEFASTFGDLLSRTADLPTGSLINAKAGVFQKIMTYTASSEPRLRVGLSGFRMDTVL